MASSDVEQKFERIRAQLKARLGSEVYSNWFGRMKVAEASKGVVRLSVPTAFLRSWITSHYMDALTDLWKREEPDLLRVEVIARSAARGPVTNDAEPPQARGKVTKQSHQALAASTTVAGRPERSAQPRTNGAEAPEPRQTDGDQSALRQRRTATLRIVRTAGCSATMPAKASSTHQSKTMPGRARRASSSAGKVWMTSPIDEVLTIRSFMRRARSAAGRRQPRPARRRASSCS